MTDDPEWALGKYAAGPLGEMSPPVEGQWVTLPLSEFENLHETERLLRAQIEKLQVLAEDYRRIGAGAVAEARKWRTVVAAVHREFGGHRNPYLECPDSLCVAARMGSRD